MTSSSSTTRTVSWLISPLGGFGQDVRGEGHLERGALARSAVHEDGAPVLLDDPVGDAEPQPGAPTDALGAEERVVDPLDVLALDAVAGVLHLHDHGFVVGVRAEREPAPAGHGVARVQD